MTTHRTIASTETDPQAPGVSALFKALADNPTAIAEGASGAPRIQDAALDTGAATAAGATWVGLRIVGLAVGVVGSHAFLAFSALTTAAAGSTHAASGLRYSNAAGGAGVTPSGTWRLMGQTTSASVASSTSLFVRVS